MLGSNSQRQLPSEEDLRQRLALIQKSEPEITLSEYQSQPSQKQFDVKSVKTGVTEAEMRSCLESTRHLENLKNPYYRLAIEEYLMKS